MNSRLFVSAASLAFSTACLAQQVEERAVLTAAKNAIRLCSEVGAGSFDDCVNLGGRGPGFTAARLSSVELSKARTRFMSACRDGLMNCQTDFNFLLLQALKETPTND